MTAHILAFLSLITIMLTAIPSGAQAETATATFAGGCFWCMEPPFENKAGVISVVAGFTGGKEANPSYRDVSNGKTGHFEAIQVTYDPQKVSYEELLDIFWHQIDPTDTGGQFADRGLQYRTAIFYHNEEQKRLARKSLEKMDKSGMFDSPIVTEILKAGPFYMAEDYHQDYYKKNPLRYKYYKWGSGRAEYLKDLWNK